MIVGKGLFRFSRELYHAPRPTSLPRFIRRGALQFVLRRRGTTRMDTPVPPQAVRHGSRTGGATSSDGSDV